jgi:hypothetical protein
MAHYAFGSNAPYELRAEFTSAFGGNADMARLVTCSTRSRMTHNGHQLHSKLSIRPGLSGRHQLLQPNMAFGNHDEEWSVLLCAS